MLTLDSNNHQILQMAHRIFMPVAYGLSVICYLAACVLPAYATGCHANDWVLGREALLMGWLAVGFGQFAWLANVPLWIVWLVSLRAWFRPTPLNSIALLVLAVIGLPIALSFYLNQDFVWCGSVNVGIPKVIAHGTGLYFWFASFSLVLVGGLWAMLRSVWVATRG